MRKFIVAALLVAGSLLWAADSYSATESDTKVFWMVTVEVPLAELPSYHKFNQEKLFPLQAKHGYKWVAAWQTVVGDIEEVIAVAEFESMDAYLKARKSLLGSAEWAALSPEVNSMMRSVRTRLVTGTAYSPLK